VPQLFLSIGTQRPAQSISLAPQRHWPAMQDSVGAQTCPQVPQFAVSLAVAVQMPLQSTSLLGHAQVPPKQPWVGGQTLPHVPQLRVLVAMFVQTPLQRAWPAGQTHCDVTQSWPGMQTFPHPPQFFRFEVVSTQTPLQSVRPAGQSQSPFVQTNCGAVQTTPQPPQFCGSLCMASAVTGQEGQPPSGSGGFGHISWWLGRWHRQAPKLSARRTIASHGAPRRTSLSFDMSEPLP
jgi:hypothetical protein